MNKILRSALLIGGVASTLAMSGTSANAAGAGAFVGQAKIASFGTGTSSGQADLCVTGTINGITATPDSCTSVGGYPLPVPANVHATFSVFEDGATCPATGEANGSFNGVVDGDFRWVRVGATALITILPTKDFAPNGGTGAAAFAVTSAGLVCGGTNVTAAVAGAIVAS